MRVLMQTPAIRAMTISSTIGSGGSAVQQTVFALYLTNELLLGPVWFGVVLGILGAAAFVGTFLAGPAERYFGPGPALILGSFFWGGGGVLLALVGPMMAFMLPLLALAQVSSGIGRSIASINQLSLRQAITPDHPPGPSERKPPASRLRHHPLRRPARRNPGRVARPAHRPLRRRGHPDPRLRLHRAVPAAERTTPLPTQ